MRWDFAVQRTPQCDHDRTAAREKNIKHSSLDWRVKAANYNLISLSNFVRPPLGEVKCLRRCCTGCEEGNQISIQQLLVTR